MKKKQFIPLLICFLAIFYVSQSHAQVGIGTVTPNASSVLDLQSTTQGLLTPRMTTAQKLAIASPANGLFVYDTDLKAYSYYDLPATTWVNIASGRTNFKRIKSTDVLSTVLAAELAAGGGTKYLLNTLTLYEINGTILFNLPIELNNAAILGLDANEDKIVKSAAGDLFTGTTGGNIKVVTLVNTVGNVFNINGGGTQNLIFRDTVIANSANVGVLENFSLIFASVIQYAGNTNGIIYRDISKLLLDNQAWFGNNAGTMEKYEGTFAAIQKQGGFFDVNGTAIGVDVSSNPAVANGIMNNVNYSGTLSTGLYVKGYTVGTYTGYSFDNKWEVNSSGIPLERDVTAVGDVNFDLAVGSGVSTTLTTGTPVKIAGTTTSNNFFRASTGGSNNRLQYLGNKKRFFTVNATGSFQASTNASTTYVFYIARNGTVISRSKTYLFTTSTSDVFAFPLQCVVELSPNDYVEVFAERFNGSSNMLTVSLSLFMK